MGKKFGNWIIKNILYLVILALFLFVGITLMLRFVTRHGQEITVPDFTGMTVAEARETAARAHITVDVIDSVYVRRMARGTVFKHSPAAGSYVKQGRRIMLTINAVNPKKVMMPNLVGYSMRQAKSELLSRGLQLGRLVYVSDIATNNVLGQLYHNSPVTPGIMLESESAIDLVVGLNMSDSRTFVPNVLGMSYLNARNAVHDQSLNIGTLRFDNTVKDYADSLTAVVYRQYPVMSEEYSVRMGSSVELFLTTDKSKVPAITEELPLD